MRMSLRSRHCGQGMTEYIIIVALIAIAAIGVFTFFGGTIRNQIAGMSKELSGQTGQQSIDAAKQQADQAAQQGQAKKTLQNYGNQ